MWSLLVFPRLPFKFPSLLATATHSSAFTCIQVGCTWEGTSLAEGWFPARSLFRLAGSVSLHSCEDASVLSHRGAPRVSWAPPTPTPSVSEERGPWRVWFALPPLTSPKPMNVGPPAARPHGAAGLFSFYVKCNRCCINATDSWDFRGSEAYWHKVWHGECDECSYYFLLLSLFL